MHDGHAPTAAHPGFVKARKGQRESLGGPISVARDVSVYNMVLFGPIVRGLPTYIARVIALDAKALSILVRLIQMGSTFGVIRAGYTR